MVIDNFFCVVCKQAYEMMFEVGDWVVWWLVCGNCCWKYDVVAVLLLDVDVEIASLGYIIDVVWDEV